LRVDPDNDPGRKYWNEMNHEQTQASFSLPKAPVVVPEWAFSDHTISAISDRLINWYIDNRQISMASLAEDCRMTATSSIGGQDLPLWGRITTS
jgi:hypothetical protein